jgi:hypothetical protein
MIRRILLTIFLIIPSSLAFVAQASAYNPLGQACTGNAASSAACQQASSQGSTDPIAGPDGIINKAAGIIAIIAGIAAVIVIIVGGFSYITSAGNAESAKKARQRILGAVIGLVVVFLAWSIVRYVSDNVLK